MGIREWGWTMPVLVDEHGTLIAGHGRVLAAQQLGITDVPTMVARGWTQAQIQAYRVTDNQLALNAGWDRELLGLELGELSSAPLTKLIPYARNARPHSDEQVAQIAASIREWGWTVPVLVDEQGTLIAGSRCRDHTTTHRRQHAKEMREHRLEPLLPLVERPRADGFAIEMEDIEQEKDQGVGVAGIGCGQTKGVWFSTEMGPLPNWS